MKEGIKRLFFGVEVHAPWPEKMPHVRIVQEECRHLTLAFLGNIPWQPFKELLPSFPQMNICLGDCGYFDSVLFLPKNHPRVAAWHVEGLGDGLRTLQRQVASWLKEALYPVDERPFLPHVTLARTPFSIASWQESFEKLPMITGSLHLYESLGELVYSPLWSYPLLLPFQQIEHTADLAYRIRGQNLMQLEKHALAALAFAAPPLIDSMQEILPKSSLDDVIISLNEAITAADLQYGIGLKAVSFHGDVEQKEHGLEWEMIVDV